MKKPALLQIALLALGVSLVVLGVMQGDARDALMKAVNVCLECIGIG